MKKRRPTISVADLQKDPAGIFATVRSSDEPVFILERGCPTAVLMNIDAYERSRNERELLLLLARSMNEIEIGSGHSLDTVMAEADAQLRDD